VDEGLEAADRSSDDLAILRMAVLGIRLEADAAENARARRNGSEATDALDRGIVLHGRAVVAAGRLAPLAMLRGRVDADLVTAGAEVARLQGEAGADAWRAVAVARDQLHEPFEAACARWRLAEALLHGRTERAGAERSLREAHAGASALGALPLLGEIEAVARRARVDLAAEADASTPPVEPSPASQLGLSERELEVLVLVADGRSNREIGEILFITEKTAGHHVSNILGKLGVATRVEAAAVAHRAGLMP
jgi:DNA-binding NarL/FixJ family response regulator